jgi:uncharacterized membrane protein
MVYNSLKYSLKVWLTSVLVSPLIFVLLLCLKQTKDITEIFNNELSLLFGYVTFVFVQMILSCVTWFLFWIFILLMASSQLSQRIRIWAIFFVAMILTVGTFALILLPFDSSNDRDGLINLMYANCMGIGWGVWYYKLE